MPPNPIATPPDPPRYRRRRYHCPWCTRSTATPIWLLQNGNRLSYHPRCIEHLPAAQVTRQPA